MLGNWEQWKCIQIAEENVPSLGRGISDLGGWGYTSATIFRNEALQRAEVQGRDGSNSKLSRGEGILLAGIDRACG